MEDYRISKQKKWIFLGLAGLFDLIQFLTKGLHLIPVIGTVIALLSGYAITGIAGLTFYLLFKLSGVSVAGGDFLEKKFFTLLTSALIELTPVINGLPGWTFYVYRIITLSRLEDDLKRKISKPSFRSQPPRI